MEPEGSHENLAEANTLPTICMEPLVRMVADETLQASNAESDYTDMSRDATGKRNLSQMIRYHVEVAMSPENPMGEAGFVGRALVPWLHSSMPCINAADGSFSNTKSCNSPKLT